MKQKKQLKKTTLYIKGMHCPSCDILVQDRFGEINNIHSVKADHKNQKADISHFGELDIKLLNEKLNQFGYQVQQEELREAKEPFMKRLTDAGSIAIVLFILYFVISQTGLLPNFTVATASLTLLTAFLLGLVASTSTCMATSGALFIATVGKLQNKALSFQENILPALNFNLGRIISYGFFGYAFGLVGKTAVDNLHIGPLLNLFVSAFMILIGLNMLKLISFSFGSNSFTNQLFQRFESKLIKHPKKTSFFLGALTYFLPCGFTQSVQLYALGLANPIQSSLMMMAFALGTVPMLVALGFASSFTRSSWYPLFSKVMGIVILVIGITYFSNFISLYGIKLNSKSTADTTSAAKVISGIQEIQMNVDNTGYVPNSFTVKAGIPVRWVIKAKSQYGCQNSIVAPTINVQKTLTLGENAVEFTPKEKGIILFSCTMGMYRGQITVI